MSNDYYLHKINDSKTNHLLHLVLSILTGGLWLPVWFILSILNSLKRSHYERKLTH